jgi:diguanylate cyclase (GGDEF)-like protein
MASTARVQRIRRSEDPSIRSTVGPEGHEGDAILRHLTDFLDAFMWQADPATLRITFVTTSVRDLLGHPVSRWVGAAGRWSANIHPQDRERVVDCLRATGADGADREVEFRADHEDGRELALRLVVRLVSPPSGKNELWGITTDITGDARAAATLRATQERFRNLSAKNIELRERYRTLSAKAVELRRQAFEDPLTKLPNRPLFDDRLGVAHRNAQRSGASFAVLLMDLDRFKEVNDTHGHQAGDAVLRAVALRLRICLRTQDTPARIGGDEFVALLPDADEAGAVRVASRIVRAMQSPFDVDDAHLAVGVSIGIALFPDHGDSAEELLARADAAMYRVKEAGGGGALATREDEMPGGGARRRRRLRSFRWVAVGVAVGLASLVGAISPVAQQVSSRPDPASRLDAATVALRGASRDEILGVVASAEQTLSEIPWKDVAGPDVARALDRLKRTLAELGRDVPPGLADRVDRLLVAIHQAELVAHISGAARPAIASKAPRPKPNKATSATVSPSRSSVDPTPYPTPFVFAPPSP